MENEIKKSQDNRLIRSDVTGSPSTEASQDPAPTRHAPTTEAEKAAEKSKYAATEVWESPKGNRLG